VPLEQLLARKGACQVAEGRDGANGAYPSGPSSGSSCVCCIFFLHLTLGKQWKKEIAEKTPKLRQERKGKHHRDHHPNYNWPKTKKEVWLRS
jgi:hypothetical protein